MNKQDRGIAFTIAIVLLICTISLIAILNSLWQLVGPGVQTLIAIISNEARTVTANYNFQIPSLDKGTTSTQSSTSSSTTSTTQTTSSSEDRPIIVPSNYTYNFPVPDAIHNVDEEYSNLIGFEDSILTDAQLVGYGSGSDTPQISLFLSIPKINVKSPVLQGLGSDELLKQGFWVYPGSYPIGVGEMILLCHRRYFGPYDPRSCWNLDKMSINDEIFIRRGEQQLTYKVVGVNEFTGDNPSIYNISSTKSYLKIVTCTPLYSNDNRLVVLAELVG